LGKTIDRSSTRTVITRTKTLSGKRRGKRFPKRQASEPENETPDLKTATGE